MFTCLVCGRIYAPQEPNDVDGPSSPASACPRCKGGEGLQIAPTHYATPTTTEKFPWVREFYRPDVDASVY